MRRKKYTNFATKPAKSSLPAETVAILPHPAGETEIPAAPSDATFVQEFATRLGKRSLSESNDRQQAIKLLPTNPGLFTAIFVLSALFAIVAVFAAMALFGFPGPVSVDSENAARFARRELLSPSVISCTSSFAAI